MMKYGDLSYYYNKIQEKLINQQDIISIQSKFLGIGEVAAGMAHDINNPASSIERTVNLLYEFKVDSDEEDYKLLLDNMKIAIDRILKIVNNAREQFRNTSNESKGQFNLKELINSIEISEESEISRQKCELITELDENIIVWGIKAKMYQVISNIVINSLNAYKDKKMSGKIYIRSSQNNQYINIEIQDEAGGIPKEIQEKLFEKIITTRGVKRNRFRIIFGIKYNKGRF